MRESEFNNEIWKTKKEFTESEMSEILGVTRRQLELLRKTYRLPMVKKKYYNRFIKKQVIQWIDKERIKKELSPTKSGIRQSLEEAITKEKTTDGD